VNKTQRAAKAVVTVITVTTNSKRHAAIEERVRHQEVGRYGWKNPMPVIRKAQPLRQTCQTHQIPAKPNRRRPFRARKKQKIVMRNYVAQRDQTQKRRVFTVLTPVLGKPQQPMRAEWPTAKPSATDNQNKAHGSPKHVSR